MKLTDMIAQLYQDSRYYQALSYLNSVNKSLLQRRQKLSTTLHKTRKKDVPKHCVQAVEQHLTIHTNQSYLILRSRDNISANQR